MGYLMWIALMAAVAAAGRGTHAVPRVESPPLQTRGGGVAEEEAAKGGNPEGVMNLAAEDPRRGDGPLSLLRGDKREEAAEDGKGSCNTSSYKSVDGSGSSGCIPEWHRNVMTKNSYQDSIDLCAEKGQNLCKKFQLCHLGAMVPGGFGSWTPVNESYQYVEKCNNYPGGAPGWGSTSNLYSLGTACCLPGLKWHRNVMTKNSYQDSIDLCAEKGRGLCTKAEMCPDGVSVPGGYGSWTPVKESFQYVSGCNDHPGGAPGWGSSTSNSNSLGTACCILGATNAPSGAPTNAPSGAPTKYPTPPTATPTFYPSNVPTLAPTLTPTLSPTYFFDLASGLAALDAENPSE